MASLILGAALSLAASIAVAAQWLILGSFEGRWFYGYGQPFTLRPLVVGVLASAAAAALLRASMRVAGKPDWALVLVWIVAGVGLQALVRSVTPVTLESLFVSDAANSFYSVTQHYDAGDLLGRFNRIRSEAPLHAQSNMPGKVMLLYALQFVSTRTDVLPWLVVMVSNLGAALIYVFVRDLFEDRRAALFAAVLYLFTPAKLFFFPLMNTVTPVIVLSCACLLLRWIRTGRTLWAASLGAGVYGLVFFEPLPLVMGLLFLGLSLRAIALGQIAPERFVAQACLMVLTLIATSEVVNVWSDFEIVRAFRQIGAHAVEFNATEGRPYQVWILANLGEFLFGVGLCQALVFGCALVVGLRGPDSWRTRLTRPITALCLSLLAVLVVTDLLGVNRGEVIRLWIFLACFVQIPAAYVCARLESTTAMAIVVSTSAIQAALGTAMIRFVIP